VEKQSFPFELVNTDYAHRALDLLNGMLLLTLLSSASKGVLLSLPWPSAASQEDIIGSVDLLLLVTTNKEWPSGMGPKEAFLSYLYDNQKDDIITTYQVFRTSKERRVVVVVVVLVMMMKMTTTVMKQYNLLLYSYYYYYYYYYKILLRLLPQLYKRLIQPPGQNHKLSQSLGPPGCHWGAGQS